MSWIRKVVLVGSLPAPYQERLREEFPGLSIVDCSAARDRVAEELADAQIAFGRVKPEEFARARALEFIQSDTQGIEAYMYPELLDSDVRLANVGDLYSPPMAEHVLALTLALLRSIPFFVRMQQEARWEQIPAKFDMLRGKTVGFVGAGSIARHCARLLAAFDCRLIATSRTGAVREPFHENLPLHELLSAADVVVASLPNTPDTYRLLDAQAMACMKPTALFINVGRGKTIDESALIAALEEGRIAGAGLDVFEKEPLPTESPLWRMENVIITPHYSAGGFDYKKGLYEVFAENLRRLRDGRPLQYQVDKTRGY
jgi:phosphoglycerate dehydrogenase-like enzyme